MIAPSSASRILRDRSVLRICAVLGVASCALGAALAAVPPPKEAAGRTGEERLADWWPAASRAILESEYHVTWQSRGDGSAGWQAPNRTHEIRTWFDSGGITVVPRGRVDAHWEFSLSRIGQVRAGELVAAEPSTLGVDAQRVEIDAGSIFEWFENSPKGLEHGLTIAGDPAEDHGPLEIRYALGGDLSPLLDPDGLGISFVDHRGVARLRYDTLVVTDATGRSLPAMFSASSEADERFVAFVIDDSDATYPLGIDPLLTTPAWNTTALQAESLFGQSVATAGDVNGDGYSDLIVGAPLFDNGQFNEGVAFAYLGGPGGPPVLPDWSFESDELEAEFGHVVATAGDLDGDGYGDVVVGAPQFSGLFNREGRAYAFLGSASGLGLTPAWTDEGGQGGPIVGAEFGYSVATAGDVDGDGFSDLIVGCRRCTLSTPSQGRAFVYRGSNSGPSPDADWTYEGAQENAFLGHSVGTAGDVNGDGFSDVIVGSYLFSNGQTGEGLALVFHGSAGGLPPAANWIREGNLESAGFGISVHTAGDVNADGYSDVIVGAYQYSNGSLFEGAAYVFAGGAGGLGASPIWQAEGDQTSANFGWAVSTVGDVDSDGFADIVVGARFHDNGQTDEGRATVYHGSPSGPAAVVSWSQEGEQAGASFGWSVAPAGDVDGDGFADLIVGAPSADGGGPDEGRAYLYRGRPDGLPRLANAIVEGNQAGGDLGFSVDFADVNGDGYSDLLVGAPLYDFGEVDEGIALAYLGSSTGVTLSPAWLVDSNQAGAQLGYSIARAGDVNGDGFEDILVSTPSWDNGQSEEGKVQLHYGASGGAVVFPAWVVESEQAGARLGWSVAAGGDGNGDGLADFVAAAPFFDAPEIDEGRVLGWRGSRTVPLITPEWTMESNQAGAELGASISRAGDFNGDGLADVIVGAPGFDNGQSDEGAAFLYVGAASTLYSLTPSFRFESNQANARFAQAVATAGDVDRDGNSDVIIGAPRFDSPALNAGAAFVYHGRSGSSVTPLVANISLLGNQTGAEFGAAVATTGDINGDGFSDIVVGEPLRDGDAPDSGRASVHLGSSTGVAATATWTSEGSTTDARWGRALASAGDVNGDGFADVAIGALIENGENDEGGAVVYLVGDDGISAGTRPRQRRGDDSAAVAPLGLTECLDCVRLATTLRTPFGRGRVRPQWELRPFGQPLDGSAVATGAITDSGAPAVNFSQPVAGLAQGVSYHWRFRLRHEMASTPFLPASRWLTPPTNGWDEADFRVPQCLDADGDGFGSPGAPSCPSGPQTDCDDANPNCTTNCTDADSDGFCVTFDCDEANVNCTSDCTDADADNFCVTADCDDAVTSCTTSCVDVDDDGLTVCAGDCNDVNPNCTTNCTDADSDGYCVTHDCSDSIATCSTSCVDADSDGLFLCAGDCNDTNQNCTTNCADADADGYCVTTDCSEANPHCTTNCTDADSDGYCVTTDCSEANPNCTTNCTDADSDGYCLTTDCDDSNPEASPGGSEVCADGADNDCDGDTDGDDAVCGGLSAANLRFASKTSLNWTAAPAADSHALYRGTIAPTGLRAYDHVCEASELSAPAAVDIDLPPNGEGFYYLATGLDVGAGPFGAIRSGALGQASGGIWRDDSTTIRCGARIHVDPDAVASSGTGLSWASAYTSLSRAFTHPRSPERGLEVWVSGTIANSQITINGTSREGARILGGFAGTESNSWQRSPSTNVTTWSGGVVFGSLINVQHASVVLDGLTLDGVTTAVQATGFDDYFELTDVTTTRITSRAFDLTVDGGGSTMRIGSSDIDPVRAVCRGGLLDGRIVDNQLRGGNVPALELVSRPLAAAAQVGLEILRNRVFGGPDGVILAARADDLPLASSQTSFFASNLVSGVSDRALLVEATGQFAVTGSAVTVQSIPIVVGNTFSDAGQSGIACVATRNDITAAPALHSVRAVPQLWDNQATYCGGPAISESDDDTGQNLVADPILVGNNLFGSAVAYLDEGGSPLATPAEVNVLLGAADNILADPLYVARGSNDYRLSPTGKVTDFGGSMRYLANLGDPGIGLSWTAASFVDSGWTTGIYGVGYETAAAPPWNFGLITTPVPAQSASIYTRVSFVLGDAGEIQTLLLDLDFDDGVVAWINGTEVFRSASMPGGAIAWDTFSGLHEASNAASPVFETHDISTTAVPALVDGTNVLAIGVWNGPLPSSDLLLVPRLVFNRNPSIDGGHTTAPRRTLLDLEGGQRMKDGDGNGTIRPDIGASER